MTYTALAVIFILVCVGMGALGGSVARRPWVPALLAMAMVVVQFALLVSR
ncbi:MAG: hypothetical protein ACRDF9_12865 [Candidatus Limnocylindria bacterium]